MRAAELSFSPTRSSLDERLTVIRSTAWGHDLGDDLLRLVADHVRSVQAPAGTRICAEGERGDFMAFVLSGRLRVVKRDYFQEDQLLALLGPGTSFGEMALVDQEPRSATVWTVEDSTLLILDVAHFHQLIQDHPTAAVQILFQMSHVLSQRVRFLNRRVLERLQ